MTYIPPALEGWVYIISIHGPLYMGSHIPPQSELPAQRCSRLDNKKANTPRSLNYRRSGVQDWTTRKPTPPRSLNYRHSGVQDWTTRKPTPPRSLNHRRSGVQDWTRIEYKESTKG